MTLPLGKNIPVTVGSKSAIRVCVIDNGSDTAYTFDEKGVHHIGEQYTLPPTPLNLWRSSPRALTGGDDYLPIGSVNFTYWLSPIANKQRTHFEFAKLQKGDLLTIYERSGNNQIREKITIDLLKGNYPKIDDSVSGSLDDKFYGNVQLFKLADNDYYMPGARLADFESTLSTTAGNINPASAVSTYTRLNTTPGNIRATRLKVATSPTGGAVICPNSVTHIGTLGGVDYFTHSNTGNPTALSVGPMIGLLRANTLNSYGGRIVLATAQTFRLMGLNGNTATELDFTTPIDVGPYTRDITQETPGITGGSFESGENIYSPPLLGNIAPLFNLTTAPTTFSQIADTTSFCMMRIGDRYVLHSTTFPEQTTETTVVAGQAPTFTPIAELPSGTYDAMYCNVSRYASNGPGIDCSLFVTDTSQTQSTNVRRQSALSGIASQTTSLPSDTYIRGTLRGFRLDRIELPMSMTQGDTIYDIVSIDPVSNQVANILFQRRDI